MTDCLTFLTMTALMQPFLAYSAWWLWKVDQ